MNLEEDISQIIEVSEKLEYTAKLETSEKRVSNDDQDKQENNPLGGVYRTGPGTMKYTTKQ